MTEHVKNRIPGINFKSIYQKFNAPATMLDCGAKCAPHNPAGKPFCCDICHAVPAAFWDEWRFLDKSTNLWHPWRGDECDSNPENS